MFNKLKEKYNSLSVQVRATVWFLVCSILQKGISVITTPIFTRLLSTEEYGDYTVFNSWLTVITAIVTLSISSGAFYIMGVVKFKEDQKAFSSSMQGLILVLCSVWTVIYLLFHDFWNELLSLTTVQMLAMFVMIWATASLQLWMTEQRNAYRYRAMIIVTLIVSVMKPVVGIILVINAEDKVTARILGLALVELVGYSWCFFVQMHHGKKFFSKYYWKYAITFNLPLLPHYLSQTILTSADKIMIQNMVGSSEAGIFGLAYSIATFMQLVNDALGKTVSPWIYQKINEKKYDQISKAIYPSLILIAVADLLLIAVAPEIVAIFATDEYQDAIYIIPPLTMSLYMQFLYTCFAPFEFSYDKRAWTTFTTVLSAVLNIVLNWIFIELFGYFIAGYMTLICYTLSAVLHYFFMNKVCKTYMDGVKPLSAKVLLLISIAFLVIGFLYIPMYSNWIVRYAFTILLIVIVISQHKKIIPIMKELIGNRKATKS